jgi:2-polyprenyl-6-methoxyphenol hydroxylase-like FAD-dependent oxidoreductase
VKVAIAGAGIGGLCLAQGLLRAGLEVAVYERDQALDSAGQGYRLHIDAGPALRACLPPDLYELCAATSGRPGTAVTVATKRLRVLRRLELGPPTPGPLPPGPLPPGPLPPGPLPPGPLPPGPLPSPTSANRQTLREILAARLDGVIEFGRTCTGFEQDAGGVTVQFSDGSSADADVLVGADGIGSPVRHRYLPHAAVEDTGVVCLYGRTPLTAQTRPLLPAPVREGFTAVLGGGIGLAAGLLDFREAPRQAAGRIAPDVRLSPAEPYLMWAVTGAARQFAGGGETGQLAELSPADLHATAWHAIRRWHPGLVRLVALAEAEATSLITIRIAVPVTAWPPSRVTLLGDAIHAMSPARGSGANTALRDAALLAAELAAACGAKPQKPPVQAIGCYERQMTGYGFAAVRASRAELAGGGLRLGGVLSAVSFPRPAGWFPRRDQAAARQASGGQRRAARPGKAR